jgi:uncharacterized protein YjbJ (UPF0337 family)
MESVMNWDKVEGNWKQFEGKVKQKWGKLTDDDLTRIEGKRTELLGLIQTRYGQAKDVADREIDDWVKDLPH